MPRYRTLEQIDDVAKFLTDSARAHVYRVAAQERDEYIQSLKNEINLLFLRLQSVEEKKREASE